jgi:hypothetical protein
MTEHLYREGLSLGHEYAQADRADRLPLASAAETLLAEAREAREDSATWRAFRLGIARGYRDAVRTLRGGRWGT